MMSNLSWECDQDTTRYSNFWLRTNLQSQGLKAEEWSFPNKWMMFRDFQLLMGVFHAFCPTPWLIIQSKSDNKLKSCKKNEALSAWREFKWLSSTNVSTHNIIPTVPNIYRFSRRLNPLRPWDPTSASSQISMSMMVSLLSKLLPQKSCHGNCYLVDVHNMMISEIVNDVNKRCVCIHNIIFVWLFRLKVRESNFFAKQRKTSHATPWPLPERWMLKPINQSTVLEKIKPIVVWSDNFREKKHGA